ncbi:hypothetical protein [Frigoriflavimonas asaccharolytica]|uniref:Lipoprotein n=1 Tax=Frigoriflavimonas asaccharolytica TaxID=2735899 RepID=A0A8J8GCY1_9FLAO|nr:hypothetical protein [Frigoriflavimonas asaccharolytica]NRS93944.1 hypothetical protein [Frigoriflavimonas asaccharolytica]
MIKKPIFYLFTSLSMISCQINGNFKGLYSYYETTRKQNPNLFIKNEGNICSLPNCQNVYITNGKQLSNCLKNKEKSLIYIWGPKCTSKICIPLDIVQKICTKKNIKLYIVAEYYDSEMMDKKYNIEYPIFGIDTEYYKTNVTKKYLNSFLNDLSAEIQVENRYLYFEEGKFVKSYEDLNDFENEM